MTLESNNEIRFEDERYPMKDEKLLIQKTKIDTEFSNLEVIKKKAQDLMGDEKLYEELLNFYSSVVLLIDETLKIVDVNKEDK